MRRNSKHRSVVFGSPKDGTPIAGDQNKAGLGVSRAGASFPINLED